MERVGHRTLWETILAMALFLGILYSASGVVFEVKDSTNKTCIMANFSVNFSVEYSTGAKQEKATFELPGNSAVGQNSTCGGDKEAPLLVVVFKNHSLSINFTSTGAKYKVDELVFTYSLSDKTYFPGASGNGTQEVSTNNSGISADSKTVYRCLNPHLLILGNVSLTFSDVKLEAYLINNTYSKKESHCSEDVTPTTTPAPKPTTTPVNPKQPDVGEYRLNDSSGAACLLAKMGLQLNFTYIKKDGKVDFYEWNIDPKNININGSCTSNFTTLIFFSNNINLLFNFTLNTTVSRFYLGQVRIHSVLPDAKEPTFDENNASLSYLQTTAHKSYKCNTKQTFLITSNFSIVTYSLQIQAFYIDENKFGSAVECADDQNGMLVPIVVGAALAGLVLIVLIAYLIGRKRSHAGYQTI